uniref:Putative RNA binding domain protein n=1 Tax=viral metagenome TaxID=1070528 RepID=A0A6M3L2G1_9ZZZZ
MNNIKHLLVSVNSSNIDTIRYTPSAQILIVHFHSGGVYRYSDVPVLEFQKLIAAESIGKHFAENIKTKYKYMALKAEQEKLVL